LGMNSCRNNIPDVEYITQRLVKLCKIPSPTGDTLEAVQWTKSESENLGYKAEINNKGSLLVQIPGRLPGNERTLSAHIDTLGAMVFEVKSNGRLKLTSIGSCPWTSVEGQRVFIKASSGRTYTGTILVTKAAVHVHGEETNKMERTADNMEVRIDEKVKTKDDVMQLGIKPGDFVVFDPRTEVTPSGFIKSRHLDDKASVAILLGAAKFLADRGLRPAYTTHFCITNFEEVGHGGSFGFPAETKEFLAVDMGCVGDGLLGSEYTVSICAKDSGGPYDLTLRKKLEDLCEKSNIPYVVDIFPFYGSDAGAALRAGFNVRTGCIGTGVDASHSHERTHQEGLLATARLVTAYVLSE
jgi:putative aminopeptidase FrvX